MTMMALRNPVAYYTPAHGAVKKFQCRNQKILIDLADFIRDIDKQHMPI
jgi:hypothetical protein